VEHQEIFSTHLFIKDDFISPDIIYTMKGEVLDQYIRDKRPNWQSSPNLDKMEIFKDFTREVSKSSFEILDKLNYKADEIEITDMWANVLKQHETHQPHTHSNNFLSGVFYLDAGETTPGITFQDPRPGAGVILPRKKIDNNNTNLLHYTAKTNRIIIFPSWLVHWVPTNLSTSNRISISWNIQIRGQLGEHHEFQSGNF
jgi:uncharacterized protein (TIGR02466 family)